MEIHVALIQAIDLAFSYFKEALFFCLSCSLEDNVEVLNLQKPYFQSLMKKRGSKCTQTCA